MSIRHSVKCTRAEADKFRADVKAWLDSQNIQYSRIIALTSYDGEVRVYTGNMTTRPRLRPGLKLVSQDDNSKTYIKTRGAIKELEYTSVFRDEWYNEKYQEGEKQALRTLLSHHILFNTGRTAKWNKHYGLYS